MPGRIEIAAGARKLSGANPANVGPTSRCRAPLEADGATPVGGALLLLVSPILVSPILVNPVLVNPVLGDFGPIHCG